MTFDIQTADLDRYESLAQGWRRSRGLEQFFDTNITLGSSPAAAALRARIQLTLADDLISATLEPTEKKRKKLRSLSDVLRSEFGVKVSQGAPAWEDYLTLVGFEYLSHVPPGAGPGALFASLLGRQSVLDFDCVTTWPYLRGDGVRKLLAQTGYKAHLAARWWAVEPDVLVETATDLIFVENKAYRPSTPNHGKPEKLGEMLVLGFLLARLGGRRFTLLAMTSPEGTVRLDGLRGARSLTEACTAAIAALCVPPDSDLGRAILASVRPFTWPDVLTGLDRAAEQTESISGGFYKRLFVRQRAFLEAVLDKGYKLGQGPEDKE